MKYQFTILGGTFDRFHAGHKTLIDAACENSNTIHIGITTDNFYQNKTLSQLIEPYEQRQKAVKEYLQKKQYTNKVTLVELKDIYGESLTQKDIDAIFVTRDTLPNAKLINLKRQEQNFPPVKIITVPLIPAEDNHPITSQRVRKGEINRNGQVYLNIFKTNLLLPQALRQELRKPIGEVITSLSLSNLSSLHPNPYNPLITVGDIVTLSALDFGLIPSLSIIDFKTQRTKLNEQEIREKLPQQNGIYPNPPGTIHAATVQALQQKLNTHLNTSQPQVLIISGEEDLLALPAILLAPLDALVLYGQINRGAVIVKVTENKKTHIEKLTQKFRRFNSKDS